METSLQTRHSLLQRAIDLDDGLAWNEIVQQYQHFILCVLNQLGVPREDLEDLSQQILISLARDISHYDRNRARFRAWLGTIVRNKANSYFRKLYSVKKCLDQVTNNLPRRDEISAPEIEDIIEREWAAYVASQAMDIVRGTFQGKAIEVFELGLNGHSAAEIAEKTDLSIASVYTLRKRVRKRLYLEIRKLSAELEQ